MRRLVPHLVIATVGVGVLIWTLTLGAYPAITCRDAVMAPGDVCVHARGTRQQTYQERYDAAQQARPVIGGVGALVGVFGVVLAVAEVRRAGSCRTRPDHRAAA